jgi:hypothetical protein
MYLQLNELFVHTYIHMFETLSIYIYALKLSTCVVWRKFEVLYNIFPVVAIRSQYV